MNVELLIRTRDMILENTEAFDMDVWGWKSDLIDCNSPACISGLSVYLAGGPTEDRGHGERPEYLDLTETQRQKLFYVENWPEQFEVEFRSAQGKQNHWAAHIAAARIDHFLATEGRE